MSERPRRVGAIAVCAMAAALSALLITLGFYIQLGEFGWYFFAGVCLLFTRGCPPALSIASFFAGAMVALLLSGGSIVFVLPYLVMAGPVALFELFCPKSRTARILFVVGEAAWFILSLFVIYKFTVLLAFGLPWAERNVAWLLPAMGVPVFFAYRFLVRLADRGIVAPLRQRLGRFLKF